MTKFILIYSAEAHEPTSDCRRRVGTTTLAKTLYNCFKLVEGLNVEYSGLCKGESYKLRRGSTPPDVIIIDSYKKSEAVRELRRILNDMPRPSATSIQYIAVDASYGMDHDAPPYGPSLVNPHDELTAAEYRTRDALDSLAYEIPQKKIEVHGYRLFE